MHEYKIPEIVVSGLALRNLVVGLWLHSMDEVRKLHCILNEENGNVVPDQVPVALRFAEYQLIRMAVEVNGTQRV